MPYDPPKCRITVLERTLDQDLVDQYLDDPTNFGLCGRYANGYEFV